ncbi:MAG: sulfur carrier protein ThiS adenylyltransferase ThiF [Butyribacter sp.]|nr:sulfur carrier protein ThiS adenylyltransferase ThiF [bacterium]MDY3853594.1 sulfur carrier protein ThiS adenylyltransferase ThiF [Butyribacter sp.]
MVSKEEIDAALCERHTKEVHTILSAGKVAIAGLGGLGSTIAIALARAGVGHLHLIDFDKVDISNLNRQQYRLKDIGRNKTECLKEIIQDINPYLTIKTDTVRVTEDNIQELFEQEDIICEAFDRPEAKSMLVDGFFTYFGQTKKLVSGSGMAGYASSNLIQTRKINDHFYLAGDMTNGLEKGMSLMAPRVGICAGHQANMIIRLLLGETEV